MVTGLESVGVALAILPLLVNQLDNYARGAEKIRAWRRPRRILYKYALDIGTQYTIFRNSLVELLDGVIENADKINELINNPEGGLWQDVRLQERLKARLGHSHDVFIGNVLSLNDSLIRLSERLGLDLSNGFNDPELTIDTKAVATSDPKVSRWKVLSTAVYDDLLGSVVKDNEAVRTLLEQSAGYSPPKSRQSWTHLLQRFREARMHAEGLYRAVICRDQWGCKCRDQHRVHLKVPSAPLQRDEHDKLAYECRFRVIFSTTEGAETLGHWSWREVEFKPWNEDEAPASIALCATQHQTTAFPAISRRVRFQDPLPQSTKPISIKPVPSTIADMCSSLLRCKSDLEGQILGLVGADPKSHYLMTVIQSHKLQIGDYPLSESVQQASRRDRLRIAAGLACGVVQFHGSWMKRNWDISDVHLGLRSGQGNPSLDCLYCTWKINTSPGTAPRLKEKQQGPQDRSEILFPLGLALIELSLGKQSNDLHSPCTGTMDNLQAKLNEVYNESGWGYGDAVHSCLFCPPGMASLGFEDVKFEERVLSTVVSPLLQEVSHFEGQR
ncbi:hypothetical protein BJY00DRAFT_325327 [Aspergillus carlsbadensis]|nr:hypothetical protein BJY00DRAFT_325327 [Aspergillus carlsbadensis]